MPSLNRCTSALSRLRVRFCASLMASSSLVGESVACAWPSAISSTGLALVGDWRTSVTPPDRMSTISSLSYIPSINLPISTFAWPSRLGDTSVDCIEADTSNTTTRNRPLSILPAKYGRVSANTASASRINWMINNQLCRSF